MENIDEVLFGDTLVFTVIIEEQKRLGLSSTFSHLTSCINRSGSELLFSTAEERAELWWVVECISLRVGEEGETEDAEFDEVVEAIEGEPTDDEISIGSLHEYSLIT